MSGKSTKMKPGTFFQISTTLMWTGIFLTGKVGDDWIGILVSVAFVSVSEKLEYNKSKLENSNEL
jgi:hypothetical protein